MDMEGVVRAKADARLLRRIVASARRLEDNLSRRLSQLEQQNKHLIFKIRHPHENQRWTRAAVANADIVILVGACVCACVRARACVGACVRASLRAPRGRGNALVAVVVAGGGRGRGDDAGVAVVVTAAGGGGRWR